MRKNNQIQPPSKEGSEKMSEQIKRNFVEEQKKKEEKADKRLAKSAEKVAGRIMKEIPGCELDEIKDQIVKELKKITSRDLLDVMGGLIDCPLQKNPKWHYCTGGLNQGQEEYCKGLNFYQCPAFKQYLAHGMIESSRKLSRGLKEKRTKKEK